MNVLLKSKKVSIGATIFGFLVLPFVVFGVASPPTGGIDVVPFRGNIPPGYAPSGPGALVTAFLNLVGLFEVIVWAMAVAMILWAALMFLTAAGSEEKVTAARGALIWGLVGVAVALLARVSTVFVRGILSGDGSSTAPAGRPATFCQLNPNDVSCGY